MDKKDWLLPLIAGVIGIVGSLGGAIISGHYQENASFHLAQLELTKISVTDSAEEIKELKGAAARYLAANDALVSTVVTSPKKIKQVIDQLTKVQTIGAEVMIIADEDLARSTNSVNKYSALLLDNGGKLPIEKRLNDLSDARANWMKQLRLSLEKLKKNSEKNLIVDYTVKNE